MARIRSTLVVALGTLVCLAPLALAKPKAKGKGKAAGSGSASGAFDAPLPGEGGGGGGSGGGSGSGSSTSTSTGTSTGASAASGSAGAAVEMTDDDKPSDDPTGTKENPNAPHVGDDDAPAAVTATAPPPRRTGYPIEEVLRPITLPANTSEVALDLHTPFNHADAEGLLRARYGITRQIQIGLYYDVGGVFNDGSVGGSTKFNTGKAAAADGAYLLTDWVAIHVRVPIYMQPFAMGITLGAPMKFRFGDRFAVTALDNVVDITTVNKFMPDITSESANRAHAAALTGNPVRQDGNLRFLGTAIYQLDHHTALFGTLGLVEPNFGHSASASGSGTSAQYPLLGAVQWSPSARIDLAGQLGFDSLSDASNTFAVRVTAAFRI